MGRTGHEFTYICKTGRIYLLLLPRIVFMLLVIRSNLRNFAGFLSVIVWSGVFVLASHVPWENLFFLLGIANLVTFGWYLAGWWARGENIAGNLGAASHRAAASAALPASKRPCFVPRLSPS
jgi:hypothetical protein